MSKPTIIIDNNNLVLSKEVMELLKIQSDDRIDIKYWSVNNKETFPVIAKAEVFKDTDGKRVTKKNKILYRGEQKEILLEYGTTFEVITFQNDMFKLVPLNEEANLTSEEQDLENLNDEDINMEDLLPF